MSQNILARYGMGHDPYAWRSDMDAPQNMLGPQATLSQGPAPSGYDRIRDGIYNMLGGKPANAWGADKLATAVDFGTLGMLTGAYDGGAELARGGGPQALGMAIMPGARPVGAAAKVAGKAATEAVQGIKAYHGSPHDFDRFDMSKIGTGEGAQAYGHGLYFAESEGVAKSYRNNLSADTAWEGQPVLHVNGSPIMRDVDIGANVYARDNGYDLNKAINELETARLGKNTYGTEHARRLSQYADRLREWRDSNAALEIKKPSPGRMYEVNIKASPDDFLDWDKPLSQQSEKVRGALEPYGIGAGFQVIGSDGRIPKFFPSKEDAVEFAKTVPNARGIVPVDPKGSQVLENSKLAPANRASAQLREAGIPGIKYLDQGSRGAGEGSRNYVAFDDSLIEILRKYGLMPPAVAGGAIAAQDGGEQ